MTSYETMSLERINAAHDAYFPLMDTNGELCEKIRDEQWDLVAKNEADMDAAFVLTVEKLVINA